MIIKEKFKTHNLTWECGVSVNVCVWWGGGAMIYNLSCVFVAFKVSIQSCASDRRTARW